MSNPLDEINTIINQLIVGPHIPQRIEIGPDLWDAAYYELGHIWIWDEETQQEVETNQRFISPDADDCQHFLVSGVRVYKKGG